MIDFGNDNSVFDKVIILKQVLFDRSRFFRFRPKVELRLFDKMGPGITNIWKLAVKRELNIKPIECSCALHIEFTETIVEQDSTQSIIKQYIHRTHALIELTRQSMPIPNRTGLRLDKHVHQHSSSLKKPLSLSGLGYYVVQIVHVSPDNRLIMALSLSLLVM